MYIDDKTFTTVDDFTDLLIEHFNNDENFVLVCGFTTACAISKDIMSWDAEIEIADIELGKPDINGYDGEYLISFAGNELFVERLRFEDGSLPIYVSDEDDISYIEATCDYDITEKMSNNITIFSIDELE